MPHGKTKGPDGKRLSLIEQQALVKGDAAYHSGRVIGNVQAMNEKASKNKKLKLLQIAADRKAIAHLEAEEASLMVRYTPLVARLDARKVEREHVRKVLHETHDMIQGSIGKARTTNRWAKKEEAHHYSSAARGELGAARGFTCNPGTTADRYGRTKIVPHRKDKGALAHTAGAAGATSRSGTAGTTLGATGRISRKVSKSTIKVGVPAGQR
jgi:hypothetical protein